MTKNEATVFLRRQNIVGIKHAAKDPDDIFWTKRSRDLRISIATQALPKPDERPFRAGRLRGTYERTTCTARLTQPAPPSISFCPRFATGRLHSLYFGVHCDTARGSRASSTPIRYLNNI